MIPANRIGLIRREYDRCFGCGRDNPIGLGLDEFTLDDARVRATFAPRVEFNGFNNVLHGGIVATALDEVMAWAAILVENVMVMTGTLELRFRKPAPASSSFELVGEILERRGRRIKVSGEMPDGDTTIASATGLFLVVDELQS